MRRLSDLFSGFSQSVTKVMTSVHIQTIVETKYPYRNQILIKQKSATNYDHDLTKCKFSEDARQSH